MIKIGLIVTDNLRRDKLFKIKYHRTSDEVQVEVLRSVGKGTPIQSISYYADLRPYWLQKDDKIETSGGESYKVSMIYGTFDVDDYLVLLIDLSNGLVVTKHLKDIIKTFIKFI